MSDKTLLSRTMDVQCTFTFIVYAYMLMTRSEAVNSKKKQYWSSFFTFCMSYKAAFFLLHVIVVVVVVMVVVVVGRKRGSRLKKREG